MKTVESKTLRFPWPPSNNRYYRHVGGRVLMSSDGRQYRELVAYEVFSQLGRVEPMGGRLRVEIRAYPPDLRRRDLDNLPKAMLDVLRHAGVYDDDSQIDDLRVVRCEVRPGGQVEVEIAEVA